MTIQNDSSANINYDKVSTSLVEYYCVNLSSEESRLDDQIFLINSVLKYKNEQDAADKIMAKHEQ